MAERDQKRQIAREKMKMKTKTLRGGERERSEGDCNSKAEIERGIKKGERERGGVLHNGRISRKDTWRNKIG